MILKKITFLYGLKFRFNHFFNAHFHQWPSFYRGFNPDQNVKTNQLQSSISLLRQGTTGKCSTVVGSYILIWIKPSVKTRPK